MGGITQDGQGSQNQASHHFHHYETTAQHSGHVELPQNFFALNSIVVVTVWGHADLGNIFFGVLRSFCE
jgi:hypothetical protein